MDKIAAGRARKEDKKNAAKLAEEEARRAVEDASWEEGAKKANKKKEAEAEKAAAREARKAEAEAQAAAEETAFSEKKRVGKSGANKPGGSKMTRAEIAAKILKQQVWRHSHLRRSHIAAAEANSASLPFKDSECHKERMVAVCRAFVVHFVGGGGQGQSEGEKRAGKVRRQ